MRKLFTVLYGSALYGTRTPTSDRDMKHVVLVDLRDLLLGKKITNTVRKTNDELNVRNGPEDVDEEFIPLQIFAKDFMLGQSYALEMAFAVDGDHAEQTFYSRLGAPLKGRLELIRDLQFEVTDAVEVPFIQFTRELRERFLTSNIKALMGYVVNQASLYSFKGERLNAATELSEWLELDGSREPSTMTLGEYYASPPLEEQVLHLCAKYPKYLRVTEYDIGGGRMWPCLTLLEKTLPFTNSMEKTHEVVDAMIARYGSRAAAASESNVDWKATMHALRIVDEGLKLLTEHKLEFPFGPEYAARLLAIKRGEVPLADVTAELTEKLDRLKTLEKETTLPSSSELSAQFDDWLFGWLSRFYGI